GLRANTHLRVTCFYISKKLNCSNLRILAFADAVLTLARSRSSSSPASLSNRTFTLVSVFRYCEGVQQPLPRSPESPSSHIWCLSVPDDPVGVLARHPQDRFHLSFNKSEPDD